LFERLDWEWVEQATVSFAADGPQPLAIAAFVLVTLLLLIGLSIAWTVLRFFDYRLERTGEHFRVTCGLLTKVSASLARYRIQVVTVRETLLHRLFRRVTIQVETAGGLDEKSQINRKWFIPLLPRDELPRVLHELRPGLDLELADWQPLAPRTLRRKITKGLILVALLAVGPVALLQLWAIPIIAPLLLWVVIHSILWTRRTVYAINPDGVVYRTGVLTRRTTATFFDKLQVLALGQTPFDRRHRMASLTLDTPGAADHPPLRIPYLEEGLARDLLQSLSGRTEQAAFRW
jgi:putative membrane protein